MRFESMQITNYRQYQSLNMEFKQTKETDLHVVVASNGVGKTNLLNAIQWCIYGDEPHLNDKEDAMTICNLAGLEEARQDGKKKAVVCVRIETNTKGRRIVFERTQAVNVSSYFPDPDHFKVFVSEDSGETKLLEGAAADELVDQYLPRKIRQYFFFDGEQLFNYFGRGQDTTHVKDSIHEIAQISVISKCRENLGKIIADYQRNVSQLMPKGESLADKIQQKKNEKADLDKNIKELEESITESELSVVTLNQQINGQDHLVEDNARYNANLDELKRLEEDKARLRMELLALIRKYYVLLMMYDINVSTDDYIKAKMKRGSLPPAIDKNLILKSLTDHECVICKAPISEDVEHKLQTLLDQFEVSTAASHNLMEIKNAVADARQQAANYKKDKEAIFARIADLDARIALLTEENENLNKKIRSCSSIASVEIWVEQRERHTTLIKTNGEKVGTYRERSRALEKEIEDLEAAFARSVSNNEKCKEMAAFLDFATEARSIVSAIEKEIISDVRSQMEVETMELFSKLIWKQNTYGRIELDENYKLRIFHKHTNQSCRGSLSAAESEMLALAFTIALHRVSGHDCLLFIDTPVGRVSDTNREKFAQSLVEVSKQKQLILAFTPSEYSEEIRRYFDEDVMSSFSRMHSDEEVATLREG